MLLNELNQHRMRFILIGRQAVGKSESNAWQAGLGCIFMYKAKHTIRVMSIGSSFGLSTKFLKALLPVQSGLSSLKTMLSEKLGPKMPDLEKVD